MAVGKTMVGTRSGLNERLGKTTVGTRSDLNEELVRAVG